MIVNPASIEEIFGPTLAPGVEELFVSALALELNKFRLKLFLHEFTDNPLLGVEIVVSGIDAQYKTLIVQQKLYAKYTKLHECLWVMQNVDPRLKEGG